MLYIDIKKVFLKLLILTLLFTVSIEILEFIVGRYADIDDILCNTLGSMICSILYNTISKILRTLKTNENKILKK